MEKLVPGAQVDNLPIAAQTTLISEYVNNNQSRQTY